MSEELSSILEFSEDLKDVEAPAALPENDYPGEVIGATQKHSQSGNLMAVVQFLIKPEDYPVDYPDADSFADGKKVTYYLPLGNNRAGLFRISQFVKSISAPTKAPIDLNDWVGKTALLTILNEDYEGVPQERIKRVSKL